MRRLILLSFVFIFSCSSTKYLVEKENTNAGKEVLNRIDFIEQQLNRYNNNKKANFSLVEDIVNLSGIEPKKWDGNFIGISYQPSSEDILKWKKWKNENENLFYFMSYDDKCIKLLGLKRKVIAYKTSSGEIKTSISHNCNEVMSGTNR